MVEAVAFTTRLPDRVELKVSVPVLLVSMIPPEGKLTVPPEMKYPEVATLILLAFTVPLRVAVPAVPRKSAMSCPPAPFQS